MQVLPPLNAAHPLNVDPRTGDTYFVGELQAGKRLVLRDRWAKVTTETEQHVVVALCDDEALTEEAEWGAGPTEEIAWRFAIGAACGPIDADYDESWLIAWLQIVAAQ